MKSGSSGVLCLKRLTACFCFMLGFLVLGRVDAAAAQQSEWESKWRQTVDLANKEGKVVVLAPLGDTLRRAVTEGFKAAFPKISLDYSGGRGSEQATRLLSERTGGVFGVDVIISGSTTALGLRDAGALNPIRSALILPEVTDLKYWRGNRLQFEEKEKLYDLAFASIISPVLVYNSNLAKRNEIDTPSKLLNPKWKGKIVINDPMPAGTGFSMFRHFWVKMGPTKAAEFFKGIRGQAAAVSRDQRLQLEWVSQGKYPLLLGPGSLLLQQLLEKGLEFEVLSEWADIGAFTTTSSSTVMLVNKAPHLNAANIFLNWLLTKDAQTAWSKAVNQASLRTDVPTDHLPPYVVPKPNRDYWNASVEENGHREPQEEKLLKELFGR
jgi:iron(III) transport system substrate-binding protein